MNQDCFIANFAIRNDNLINVFNFLTLITPFLHVLDQDAKRHRMGLKTHSDKRKGMNQILKESGARGGETSKATKEGSEAT